nr:mavicyanin-like isoform X2 [Coffea arabica]XP_027080355.1 mavicyanin-like isoform X2 [Coffea arabica]
MDMAKKAILLLLTVMAVSGVSPTVYTVGDVGGWSSLCVVNYTEWAAAIEFQVGDILYFEYDPGFHNVVQVRREDYHACNAKNPIATYSSGKDYIKIKSPGHYFYICGFVDHCKLTDQKVDIRVPKHH